MRRNWRGLRLAGDGSKNPTALTRTRTWLALSCVAHPVARPGTAACGPVAWIREPTPVERQAAAADAFGEAASSRSSSAMRSRMRFVQRPESLAQSERSGTWCRGSFASSAPISSSDSPIRCAKTMKATRRITARGYRRCPESLRSDESAPVPRRSAAPMSPTPLRFATSPIVSDVRPCSSLPHFFLDFKCT